MGPTEGPGGQATCWLTSEATQARGAGLPWTGLLVERTWPQASRHRDSRVYVHTPACMTRHSQGLNITSHQKEPVLLGKGDPGLVVTVRRASTSAVPERKVLKGRWGQGGGRCHVEGQATWKPNGSQ